jgi:hypothetical protein
MSRRDLSKFVPAALLVIVALSGIRTEADEPRVPADTIQPVLATKPGADSAAAGKATDDNAAVVLKYQFQPGQTVHYKVVHKMAIDSKKGRASQTADSEWTTFKHMRVVSVGADEVATLETTIDRIQASVRFDKDKPQTYDSDSNEEPPAPLRRVRRTIGKPMAMTQFTPSGRLVKSELLQSEDGEKKRDEVEEGSNDDPNGKNFLISLPETPVRVGATWKDPFTVNVNVPPNLTTPISLNRTYTLSSIENGVATISLETSILTAVNNPAVMAQLIQRAPTGTILFDVKKGIIISRRLTLDETVHEFAGAGSKMRAESTLVEALAEPSNLAAKPGPTEVVPASAQ